MKKGDRVKINESAPRLLESLIGLPQYGVVSRVDVEVAFRTKDGKRILKRINAQYLKLVEGE